MVHSDSNLRSVQDSCMIDVEYMLEYYRTRRKIFCPHCKFETDPSDMEPPLISYHGEDLYELECEKCGEEFYVQETVCRTYSSSKSEEEAMES